MILRRRPSDTTGICLNPETGHPFHDLADIVVGHASRYGGRHDLGDRPVQGGANIRREMVHDVFLGNQPHHRAGLPKHHHGTDAQRFKQAGNANDRGRWRCRNNVVAFFLRISETSIVELLSWFRRR